MLSALCMMVPVVGAACASDGSGTGTLPPIRTTTPTTTTIATTTTLPDFYVVKSGENLTMIAEKLGVSQDDLLALNGITNANHIERGQRLKVPKPGVPIPTTTTTAAAPG